MRRGSVSAALAAKPTVRAPAARAPMLPTATTESAGRRSSRIGGPGSVCADPDAYVFWDGIHPTANSHELLGDFAFAAIPVPGAVWLFGSALGLLGWLRRRAA